MKKYKITANILDMPYEMWEKWDSMEKDYFYGTPREFLDQIGLAGGKSALFTEEEKEFFRLLYEKVREVR